MKVSKLASLCGAKTLCLGSDRLIKSGYVCDLLSHVMGHGVPDMAWVTVQTHINVVAVAALLDFACVIVPEGIAIDEKVVKKASEEGVTILSTEKTAYEVVALLVKSGIEAAHKL